MAKTVVGITARGRILSENYLAFNIHMTFSIHYETLFRRKHLYTKPHLAVPQKVERFIKVKRPLYQQTLNIFKILYISWLLRIIEILGFLRRECNNYLDTSKLHLVT
jgi:hypothetical protein